MCNNKYGGKMKKNISKRYIVLSLIIVIVMVLIWKVSTSYAYVDQGYTGQNIISGDKWGVNITEIGEIEKVGNAELIHEVSTIGTTLNFNVTLFKPGDKISFNVTCENTSTLKAELYALTLSGLSQVDSEYVTYTIMPIDSSILHTEDADGSIMKSGDKQMFNISVSYDENANRKNEYNLSLGSTIIYKQK